MTSKHYQSSYEVNKVHTEIQRTIRETLDNLSRNVKMKTHRRDVTQRMMALKEARIPHETARIIRKSQNKSQIEEIMTDADSRTENTKIPLKSPNVRIFHILMFCTIEEEMDWKMNVIGNMDLEEPWLYVTFLERYI